jgi:hypothetical protein
VSDARAKYRRDAERLVAAFQEWKSEHDPAALELWLPPESFAVIAALDAPLVELVARNEAARSFVSWLDCRTNYQCSFEMFATCVRLLGFPFQVWDDGTFQMLRVVGAPSPGGSA